MYLTPRPGDLIFTHGSGLIQRAIRDAEQSPEEAAKNEPVYANHVAGFSSWYDVTEALWTVKTTSYAQWAADKTPYQVWRNNALTPTQRLAVAQVALGYVGRSYGWWKLGLHWGDALLSRWAGHEVYALRRCMSDGRYPICSWVWAYAYGAIGVEFGLFPDEIQPDDMHDFCSRAPEWEKVFELTIDGKEVAYA